MLLLFFFIYFCLLWQLLRFGLALFILCLTYDAYAKGVARSFCNKLNLYFDTKRHPTHTHTHKHTHTPGDTIKHTLAIACCCCCTIVCLAGVRLFAFVNATTQLISTRRVAHRAHKGAAATALTHVHIFVAVIPHTCIHARTHALTHGRRGTHWLQCSLVVVAVRKEVGGRAVTTQKSNSNSRSLALFGRAVSSHSSLSSFPFNIQITLFFFI